jgi:hypothetical protein
MADEESNPIKDFMRRTGCALVVYRIPKKTLEQFKKTAYEEFEGDYGMYIKFLQDIYLGIVPKGWEHLEIILEEVVKDVDELKKKFETKKEEKKEEIKFGNGRVIRRS